MERCLPLLIDRDGSISGNTLMRLDSKRIASWPPTVSNSRNWTCRGFLGRLRRGGDSKARSR